MQHGKAHSITPGFVPRSTSYDGRFGRLFGRLPPWEPPGRSDEAKETNIRAFGQDRMFPPEGERSEEHPDLPAGYTYFGQFIDHDITFDPTSSLERQNDPDGLKNFRTPRLDLDSVYGRGPRDQPYLYDPDMPVGHLRTGLGENGNEHDLLRVQPTAKGKAIALIGDPRNDENIIVSQLQLAVIKLHNKVLEDVQKTDAAAKEDAEAQGLTFTIDPMAQFHEAQRIVRWLYQYLVWNDFVRRIVPDDIWKKALTKSTQNDGASETGITYELGYKNIYSWRNNPYIPVEFSVAAYRFGHSLVRDGYQVNIVLQEGQTGTSKERPIFSSSEDPVDDLSGGRLLPDRHTIQWDWFFEHGVGNDFPQKAGLFDTKLSRGVFEIEDDDGEKHNPLATLNILRGWRFQLPSGTAVARAMGYEPLAVEPMEDALWVYILKEAKEKTGGQTLGPVGGTIVAAVFAGLLKGDHLSYVEQFPGWTPEKEPVLSGHKPFGGTWTIVDLLEFAEIPIDAGAVHAHINGTDQD